MTAWNLRVVINGRVCVACVSGQRKTLFPRHAADVEKEDGVAGGAGPVLGLLFSHLRLRIRGRLRGGPAHNSGIRVSGVWTAQSPV